MAKGANGLCPEIFADIATPPIKLAANDGSPELTALGTDRAHHGVPAFAKLDVLVAYLTAGNAIDYDGVEDFLLVYRLFTSPAKLWQLLLSRLLWAAEHKARTGSGNETGHNVGTRCFAMLKQWLTNYFAQDFVPDLDLRASAAQTLTWLSNEPPFVVNDYFKEIISQLIGYWDGQISLFWDVVPGRELGNRSAAIGGHPIVYVAHPAQSLILDGEVPINANIAVTSIQGSPPRDKPPRKKLSQFFRLGWSSHHSKKESKPAEVVLHDKVDMLAMRVINEHNVRQQRALVSSRISLESINTVRRVPSMHSPNVPAAVEVLVSPHSAPNAPIIPSMDSAHPIDRVEQDSPYHFDTQEYPAYDQSAQYEDSQFEDPQYGPQYPTFDPPFDPPFDPQREAQYTPHDPQCDAQYALHDDQYAQHDAQYDSHYETEQFQNNNRQYEDAQFDNYEAQHPQYVQNGGQSKQFANEFANGYVHGYVNEYTRDYNEFSSLPGNTPDSGDYEYGNISTSTSTSTMSRSVPEINPSHVPRTPSPAPSGDEVWATPRRRLPNTEPSPTGSRIIHEESMDTLNVNNVLANTVGDIDDSRESLASRESMVVPESIGITESMVQHEAMRSENNVSINQYAVPNDVEGVDEWGKEIDFNQFQRLSYAGSTLSPVSTRSAFSCRDPVTPREVGAYCTPDIESVAQFDTSRSTGNDSSHSEFSLLSEVDNSLMLPCPKFTPNDAIRLRKVPDRVMEGDALLATLRRLEENSEANRKPGDVTVDDMVVPQDILKHTVNPANEVRQLGIPMPQAGLGIFTGESTQQVPPPIQLTGPTSPHAQQSVTPVQVVPPMQTVPVGDQMPCAAIPHESSLRRKPTTDEGDTSDVPRPLLTHHLGLPGATHVPFVLAFDARAVAEQMTLIERDIAGQMDWQELLRNDWQRPQRPVTSWLQVIDDQPLKGAAMINARFELVYNWAQSEVLLCPSPALKAQTISRFIHIAFQSLRLHNLATMAQLALALGPGEVQSAFGSEVFVLLAKHDRDDLAYLCSLASPKNNYAKLREAHRRCSASNKPCVPFTRMYLRDIDQFLEADSLNTEMEINYGKYRSTAETVKALQHCVSSSTNYNIKPDQSLIPRCLYLAAIETPFSA